MVNTSSSFDIVVAAYQECCNINSVIFQQPTEEHLE